MENFKKNENFLECYEENGNLCSIRTSITSENHQKSETLEKEEEDLVGEEEELQGKFKEEDFKRDKFQNSMSSETFEAMKYQSPKDEEPDSNGEVYSAVTPLDTRNFEEEEKLQGEFKGDELGRNKVQTLRELDDSGSFQSYYSTSNEEEGLELEEVPCCVTTRVHYEEVPGGDNLHLPRAYGETGHTTGHDQGNHIRPDPYLPPYRAYGEWRAPPRPYQSQQYAPYPQMAEVATNRVPRYRPPTRFQHQQPQGSSSAHSQQRSQEDRVEILMRQYTEQQDLNSKVFLAKIDKIDAVLSSRIEDISTHVRKLEEKCSKDLATLEVKFQWMEEERRRHVQEKLEEAKDIGESSKKQDDKFTSYDSKFKNLHSKDAKMLKRVEELEKRTLGAETTLKDLGVQQETFKEALAGEFELVTASHKLLKEIDSEVKEKHKDLSRKFEDLSSRVARHATMKEEEEEEKPDTTCNTVVTHEDLGEEEECSNEARPHDLRLGLSLLKNRWYPHIISLKELGDFNRAVARLPQGTSFAKACSDYDIDRFFLESCESRREIRELYDQALHYPRPIKTLHKEESPGQYLVTCSIRGIEFKDALCDSGSCINVMSMDIAKKLGISTFQPSKIRIGLANSSYTIPEGVIPDIHVRIGNCNIPTDFQVINVERSKYSQLILGGSFLATTGAIMDWPNRRLSFANIDGKVFYPAIPFIPLSRRGRKGQPPDLDEKELKRICLRTNDSTHSA